MDEPPADGPISIARRDVSAHRPVVRDWELARLAGRQHGVVALRQLRGIGMDRSTVHHRVRAGRLHQLYEGVYAVGHRSLTQKGRFLAAVMACGEGAILSHRSAAQLWGIWDGRSDGIDVTAPNRRGRSPEGIRSHRESSLVAADRTTVDGIPCTTVARTLLDQAAMVSWGELRGSVSEAEVRRILDKPALRSLLRRSHGRRGVARLRLIIDELHPETRRTRSELEKEFLRACARTDLPQPEVNVLLEVGGRRVRPDFLWRDAGLILEADSRRFHDTDSSFQSDRRREQRLMVAGWRVVRCTWEQIEQDPRSLIEVLRNLLTPMSMGR